MVLSPGDILFVPEGQFLRPAPEYSPRRRLDEGQPAKPSLATPSVVGVLDPVCDLGGELRIVQFCEHQGGHLPQTEPSASLVLSYAS